MTHPRYKFLFAHHYNVIGQMFVINFPEILKFHLSFNLFSLVFLKIAQLSQFDIGFGEMFQSNMYDHYAYYSLVHQNVLTEFRVS